jgi:hypothetical protein
MTFSRPSSKGDRLRSVFVFRAVQLGAVVAFLLAPGCGSALDPCRAVPRSSLKSALHAESVRSQQAKTNVAGSGNCTYGIKLVDGRANTIHISLVEYDNASDALGTWRSTGRGANEVDTRVAGFEHARFLRGVNAGWCSSTQPNALSVLRGGREALIEISCDGDSLGDPAAVLRAVALGAVIKWARGSGH